MSRRKVLLIGWDAADWKIILPLVNAGKMPTLERFLSEGVAGNLSTINPALSPMLWTSIATGKRPFKHGIHGFSEVDPLTGKVRPVTNLSRSARAIWNILQLNGKRSIVTGWWPSHPAEPIDGAMVSNQFQIATAEADKDWPLPPQTIHPARHEAFLKDLRIHPHQLDETHLLPFVPRAAEIDQKKDRRLNALARIIVDCTNVHTAATALMQNETWDFAAVYFDAIDHFCHSFMRFHPPRRQDVTEHEFEMYKQVVEGGYRYHDMMLETLLRIAGEETTVILMSDHGFHSDHLRLDHLPFEPAGPAAEHRRYGIFATRGPGIAKGIQIRGASILDICPTILNLFGLPIGADMDGKVLAEIFETSPKIESIPSWEDVEGEDGFHPPGTLAPSIDANAALEQLVALGYIDALDTNTKTAAEKTNRELQYNLTLSYMDAGLYGKAEPILEKLHNRWPDELRFGIKLAACYHAIGRANAVQKLSMHLVRHRLRGAAQARRQMSRMEKIPLHLKTQATPDRDGLRHFLAFADFASGRYEAALKKIQRTSESYRNTPDILNTEGEILLRLRKWKEAEEKFKRVLSIDPENSGAHRGIARARLGARDYAGAADAALASIALVFSQPIAHFLLGMAWFRMGEFKKSAEAFEVTIRLNSSHAAAYRMLAEIHTRHFGDSAMGAMYSTLAQKARQRLREFREQETAPPSKPEEIRALPKLETDISHLAEVPDEKIITVVSGLPRSGTSMMMQMLVAGGLVPYVDEVRKADRSNPYGYFEHDAVKGLAKDNRWIEEARGKVIKVVAPLLPFLPATDKQGEPLHYRVIFMRRDMDDILDSQARMLEVQNTKVEELKRAYNDQLYAAYSVLQRRTIVTLEIDYAATCREPESTAIQLVGFLGNKSATDVMKTAVRI